MALSFEQEQAMVQMLACGESHRVIGSVLGCSHTTIGRRLDADPELRKRVERARAEHEADQDALAARHAAERVVVDRGEDCERGVATEPDSALPRGGGNVGPTRPGREIRFRDWLDERDEARGVIELRHRTELGVEDGHDLFAPDEARKLLAAGWEYCR